MAVFQRAAWGGNAAESVPVNGLARAERTAMRLVAADGDRTRYQGGAYEVRETSGRFGVNLGGTAGWKSCPKEGTGLFYFLF